METKHTKGKWEVKGEYKNELYAIFDKDSNMEHKMRIAVIDGASDEQRANAKLIASAPDLLKVCMDLMDAFVHKENDKKGNKTRTDIFKNCPEFRDIAVSARHAIEKATQG